MRTIMTSMRKKWKTLNRVTPPSRSPTGALYRCRPSQRGPQLFRFIGRNVIRCNRIQQDIYFISLIRGVWWGILWAEWSPFSRPPPSLPTDFGILFASKKREHEHLICHHIQCQRRQTILLQGCLSFWQLGSGLGRYVNMWTTLEILLEIHGAFMWILGGEFTLQVQDCWRWNVGSFGDFGTRRNWFCRRSTCQKVNLVESGSFGDLSRGQWECLSLKRTGVVGARSNYCAVY